MKKEKPQIGLIKFGKSRPDKTKYVLVDIKYDKKAEARLYRIGMGLLSRDKEAVINYVVARAMKHMAQFNKFKCKK